MPFSQPAPTVRSAPPAFPSNQLLGPFHWQVSVVGSQRKSCWQAVNWLASVHGPPWRLLPPAHVESPVAVVLMVGARPPRPSAPTPPSGAPASAFGQTPKPPSTSPTPPATQGNPLGSSTNALQYGSHGSAGPPAPPSAPHAAPVPSASVPSPPPPRVLVTTSRSPMHSPQRVPRHVRVPIEQSTKPSALVLLTCPHGTTAPGSGQSHPP